MSNQIQHTSSLVKVQETRERIINAAYHVLAEKDMRQLREISKAADAAPGLVHYYFGCKNQLLVEVIKAVNERYTQAPAPFGQ